MTFLQTLCSQRYLFVLTLWGLTVCEGAAPLVSFKSESECQACCIQNPSPLFNVSFCQLQGCVQSVDAAGNQVPGKVHFEYKCNVIGPVTNPARQGCELGRDYRLIGSSDVLRAGLRFCEGGALSPTSAPVSFTPSPVPSVSCESCCTALNDQIDSGSPTINGADDFQSASCKNGCNILSNPACNGFETLADHRSRLGCAIGIDLKQAGQSTLRTNIVECDINGNLALSTAEPTSAPTELVTTGTPTTQQPTANPTNFTAASQPGPSPSTFDSELWFYIGGSLGILAAAVTGARLVHQRNIRRESERPETLHSDSWMYKLYDLRTVITSRFSMSTYRSSYNTASITHYSTDPEDSIQTRPVYERHPGRPRKASL